MNNTDGFVQVMDKPVKQLTLRSDLHWIQLTSGHDLWYAGGGAFDNRAFGFSGHPANGSTSIGSVADLSANWQTTKNVGLNFYYGHVWGHSAVKQSYPTNPNLQFGYVEFVYQWHSGGTGAGKQ